MRAIKAICFALISAACAFSQAGRLDSGNFSGPQFAIYWETRVEPASPALAQSLGTKMVAKVVSDTGMFIRVLMDREHRTYFGYNMAVKAVSSGSYNLYWQQRLNLTPALAQDLRIDDPPAWTELSVRSVPGEKVVRMGDVIAIDLMVNSDTGQKIVDYISIQEPFRPGFNNTAPREFSYAAGAPRDFRVEDAALHIREPRFSVNGKVVESGRQDVSGAAVWLYAPGKGRFVFSLTPRPGFQKAGEIRGTSMTFKVGADTFAVSSAVRIAPGDAPFNLYVLHEPAWRPADTSAFTIGQ